MIYARLNHMSFQYLTILTNKNTTFMWFKANMLFSEQVWILVKKGPIIPVFPKSADAYRAAA